MGWRQDFLAHLTSHGFAVTDADITTIDAIRGEMAEFVGWWQALDERATKVMGASFDLTPGLHWAGFGAQWPAFLKILGSEVGLTFRDKFLRLTDSVNAINWVMAREEEASAIGQTGLVSTTSSDETIPVGDIDI